MLLNPPFTHILLEMLLEMLINALENLARKCVKTFPNFKPYVCLLSERKVESYMTKLFGLMFLRFWRVLVMFGMKVIVQECVW